MKEASLAEIRYFCPKFWLNSLCDYVQNPKLTSDIIHDECRCSRLLLTFWLCLLGVSWGPLGGHFSNRRYFSQNIGIISYRTILRCLHTTIYEQGLKSSGNLRNSGFYKCPQTPNSFILMQFLDRFGCFPDFFELDTAIPDEQFDLLDYFLKISNSKTK